ncbi:MAG: class I SAM-dependent methyltransferase [Deltaproteobacteria bacterium]|nr:class I SAM-dependent methyltransferase [Deltaproteobacteria bacterium]
MRGRDLCCPRCAAELAPDVGTCVGCDAPLPVIDGVRCLLHDAADARDRFAAQYAAFDREGRMQLEAIATTLADGDLPMATRARLQRLAAGVQQTSTISRMLARRGGLTEPGPHHADATVPSVAGHGPLTNDYEYLFRDWGWGAHADDEHARTLALVRRGIADRPGQRVLVLGAGAARLAYDLHHALAAGHTLAVDIHPLLVAVAARMFAGDSLVLAEFTPNHLASPHAVVERTLAAPAAAAPGLELLLADATRVPVVPGSFDVVVTPWFIDRLDRDVRSLLPAVHAALAPGGRWISYGPLLHARGKPLSACVTESELLELLPSSGFTPIATHRDIVPYLLAPDGSGRMESVLLLASEKRDGDHWSLPPWLRGIDLPIPRALRLHAVNPASPAAAAIASLVDGRRSALAIATALVRRGLPARGALDATIDGLLALLRGARAAEPEHRGRRD